MYASLIVAFLGIALSSLFYFFNKISVEKVTSIMKSMYLLIYLDINLHDDYENILYKPFMVFGYLN